MAGRFRVPDRASVVMPAVVGAAALLVAMATVGVTVWRAVRANPVETLREG